MVQQLTTTEPSRDFFLPPQAIQALRDSQYRSTALAISELIDNSIDAGATSVDVLCLERMEEVLVRRRWKIHEVAVIDNGSGMTADVLERALVFGDRMAQRPRTIGKYGMGLPTSSVSQCQRVDVWTWQDGIDNPSHSYIDVDEIKNQALAKVPVPDHEPVPSRWIGLAKEETLGPQGTLVVWSNIDRINGKAEAIFSQVNEEIGRIYRHFINEKRLTIRMASIKDNSSSAYIEENVKPNDPLYLMHNTTTPSPYGGDDPMFREWGTKSYDVTVDGRTEQVEVVYSLVKDEVVKRAREEGGREPGHFDYGKHAARNRGVSVVRQNREILLENAFVSAGGSARDPQNRWWGCEVRFGSGCDALFGVDHNKQMAAHFSRAAKDLISGDEDTQAIMDGLGVGDEDMYRIVADIRNNTNALRRELDAVFARNSQVSRRNDASITARANEIAKQSDKDAFASGQQIMTASEQERTEKSEQERIESLAEVLISQGFNADDAHETAKEWIERDDWYSCSWASLGAGSQMFKVSNVAGIHHITLNTEHPIYEFIRVIQDVSPDNEAARRAAVGVILLLQSWGKMEDQIASHNRRREVQNIAIDWGRQADEFISRLNDEG